MSTNLTNALDECLRAADPLATAAQYPGFEGDLLPLIQTAQRIREVEQAVPSPWAKAAGLERLLMAVKQTRQAQEQRLPEAAWE